MKTMKKTLLLLLLTSFVGMAQNYNQSWSKRDKQRFAFVTIGFDARNAVVGSKPTQNKSALDAHFKIGAIDNHVEVSAFYETFSEIEFQAYGANVNYVFMPLENIDIALGIEAGSVIRYKDFNFLMAGVNGELRFNLGKFILGFQSNSRLRNDVDKGKIVHSGFVNLTRKFN